MRRIACACCLIVTVSSCRPGARNVTVPDVSAGMGQPSGTIPITSRSEEARTLYLQGRVFVERLQPRDGRALFEQAIARDPTFAMAEYGLALTAPTAREAAEHLHKAVALADRVSNGERLLILAQQARANADLAMVREYVETLVAQYPQDERVHWALGNAYFGRQLYGSAIGEYQKAIAINPSYSLAYNSVGYAYRATDSLAEAEQAFQKYIALVPDDPNPYDSYAELLMKMGRFDASIAQYRKALTIDSRFGASHVGIAADHMFAGQHAAAIAAAQIYYDAARDDRERRIALFSQTVTYVDEGLTDTALELMDRAYGVARATGDTANMSADAVAIADILLDARRVDAARDRYQQAHDLVATSGLSADIKQDNELAWHYNMARVALAQHDLATAHTEAAGYLSGAEARHNDVRVRQAHELNGLVALEAKQFDGSLAELALADQQDPAVRYAMAQAYRGKGDVANADELAAQAVNMYTLPTLPYVFIRARSKPVASR